MAGAENLSGDQMQQVARWLNFSETTFLLEPTSPEATYRCRIFTPGEELPFAGHPTLGTAHAWLELNGRLLAAGETLVQECGVGLVPVRAVTPGPSTPSGGTPAGLSAGPAGTRAGPAGTRAGPGGTPRGGQPERERSRLSFLAPPLRRTGPVDADLVGQLVDLMGLVLGDVVDAQWVDNGPGWLALLLRDAASVMAAKPACAGGAKVGLVGFHPAGSPVLYEVRAFFGKGPAGVAEDPVTGSLNASVAQWLVSTGRAEPPYWAGQGRAVGAEGRVHIEADGDGGIWVGGATFTCARGELVAPSDQGS